MMKPYIRRGTTVYKLGKDGRYHRVFTSLSKTRAKNYYALKTFQHERRDIDEDIERGWGS